MVNQIAAAIFGTAKGHVQLRVISAADRIPLLQADEIDIVARNMTINCTRWKHIAFSAEYFHSGQKILVAKDSGIDQVADLSGKRACAPTGTTSLDNIQEIAPDAIPVTAVNHTGCLLKFQNGETDAITGDDTVLAGLAAQDPYAEVLTGEALTEEPYGIGVNAEQRRPGPVHQRRSRADARRRILAGVVREVAAALAQGARHPADPGLRSMTPTSCPVPPGAIGTAPEPAALQDYLGALDDWVRARRLELDELDAAALAAQRGDEVASDMALSLSLWKAVADRWQLMWATWDGGRVGVTERTRITTLIWGRLDGASGAPAVSLPEACRLSDALAGQLRATLSLMPGADADAARIKELRAQLERVRDQVGLEPALARDAAVDRLAGPAPAARRRHRPGPARRRRRRPARRRSRRTPRPSSAT